MTKGDRAFRDLVELEGGEQASRGATLPLSGSSQRRPRSSVLDGRCQGAASARIPPPPDFAGPSLGEGCAGRRRAVGCGATGSTTRVAVAKWPRELKTGVVQGRSQVPRHTISPGSLDSKDVTENGLLSPPGISGAPPSYNFPELSP